MSKSSRRTVCAAVLSLVSALVAAPAPAADHEPTIAEVLEILRANGLIDADQHAELAARAEREQSARSWTDRLSFWGDFRARYEGFVYERAMGMRPRDRHRFRYRARLNAEGKVASRATVSLRLVSGEADPRSLNQSFGSGDDFDTDDLRLDLAYMTISPFPDAELPGIQDGLLAVDVGKVPNPFRWRELAQDSMLWDGDITLEGGSLRIRGGSGPVVLFSHTGAYVIDEERTSRDPAFFASQLGGSVALSETVSAGLRGTFYDFFKLDDPFFTRAASHPDGGGGNFVDGLSRRNLAIQVLEGSGYLRFDCWELFPIQLFGSYAHNLSARSSRANPGVGQENDAYAVGISIGDKRQIVRVGMSWYYIEANAFPSLFIDSDILDSTTNRKGYAWVLERELFPGIDLVYTAYLSNRIEGGAAFADSVPGSQRFRTRVDLKLKF